MHHDYVANKNILLGHMVSRLISHLRNNIRTRFPINAKGENTVRNSRNNGTYVVEAAKYFPKAVENNDVSLKRESLLRAIKFQAE